MPYIPHSEADLSSMLKELKINSLDDLFAHLPSQIKIKEGELKLPEGLSEASLGEFINTIAEKNTCLNSYNSFLGAGIYAHYIPAALHHIVSRSEFYTSYTPYQSECSQGVLQALYEYQSYMCLLTGMEVTNTSLYDGATACAEAVLMSMRINKRSKVLIAESLHPEYRQTVKTYLLGHTISPLIIPAGENGTVDIARLKELCDDTISCCLIQSPNFWGVIEDMAEIAEVLKPKEITVIQCSHPLALVLFKEPSLVGVDIVCGDGQPLGGGMNFGGPTFGYIAASGKFLRQFPGRIVGKTVDKNGMEAFCLTLQAREQHIRREKATSNICSNQSLNAINAAVYCALLGKEGLYKAALYSLNLAHYLFERIQTVAGVIIPFRAPFFNEFVWKTENASAVIAQLRTKGILAGIELDKWYSNRRNSILSTCTEVKKVSEIDLFVEALRCLVEPHR